MSQKFISLEDAATRLGVAKDRLNQLREAGDLRAYRDGASWKFRTEDIEKLETDGVSGDGSDIEDDLTLDATQDYGLAPASDIVDEPKAETGSGDDSSFGTEGSVELEPADELKLSETSDSRLGGAGKAAPASGGGAEQGDAADDDIGLGVEPLGDGDDAESILLTGDDQLEDGVPRPQSTIIGKSELSLESDLQLASNSDLGTTGGDAAKADSPSTSGSFEDIDELELDLEAESSRIMDSRDANAARNAVSASAESIEGAVSEDDGLDLDDDLDLDLSGSDIGMDTDASDVLTGQESQVGSLKGGSVSGLSGIDSVNISHDEDDDLVLGGSDEGSGELATSDSGINLAPSDSGFALDEVPLDLGGSAIGSALDLASLSAVSSGPSSLGSSPSQAPGAEDFQLTPAAIEEEEEDSSQIVALEEVDEEDEDGPAFDSADDGFGSGMAIGSGMGGLRSGIGAEAAAAPMAVGAAQEVPFPGWIVGLLGAGFFSMVICGLMALDLLKSMWAWDEPYSLNSSVMEGLLSLFGA